MKYIKAIFTYTVVSEDTPENREEVKRILAEEVKTFVEHGVVNSYIEVVETNTDEGSYFLDKEEGEGR